MLRNEGSVSAKADERPSVNPDDLQSLVKESFEVFGTFCLGDFMPRLDQFSPHCPQGLKKRMSYLKEKFDKLDLTFASLETTMATIECGQSVLVRNPNVLEKAEVEMDLVVGRGRQRDPEQYKRPSELYTESFIGNEKDVHSLDFDFSTVQKRP
ncbi:hypothetical protein R1flu_013674 [Riccia fluitans]|uniref:Uncharacterized protein n=1 Tax=Riccia fluitans TaxID=41844 RepID=A0ABD1YE89_9MARC